MSAIDNAHALVVGIADYANIRKLPKVRDAEDLAAALVDPSLCGYNPNNVTVLLDRDATREKICAGLEALAKRRGAGATVFIYFSGHGGQIRQGPNRGQYLLPVDVVYTADEDLAHTAIPGTEFTEILNGIKAKRLTVVLDCCHAGGIGEPRGPASGEPVAMGVSDDYLDELKAGTGRVIISATRATDPAYVRPGANYGVFTGHFLAGLRGAARGDGGVIRILDLYSYVQEKVVVDQPNQRPVLKVELEENYPVALYRGGQQRVLDFAERPDDSFQYDVFLSYRNQDPDKTWVRKTLYPRLKSEGLKLCLDVVDFRLGVPVINEMERAVVESRYTLAVLTPAYLSSNFSDFENVIAQHLGLEQSQRRFLGLVREPCKPRLGIRALYYLDMTDDDEVDLGIARLATQLRERPDRKAAAT
jgi:Caspase domain/TIR domain